ncbi:MAG: NlpC/P60 domain-containing protein [Clostridium sp.]|jgi:gamma-D-glutamyl-L-lysine dipeptidyl-peptidase
MNFALVRSMIAPMMQKASEKSELADESLCGYKVEILKQDGQWCLIRTGYQYEGWVLEKHLCREESLVRQWDAAPKKVVLQAHADILTVPKVQGNLVAELTRGALVSPLDEESEGWQKVRLCDGREGWTWGAFLGEYRTDWNKEDEAKLRRALTETALSYLGTQYRWGGKTPLGIDCSGLCSMAYLLNGIIIHRDAHMLPQFCMHPIDFKDIKPGDLMFFPGHVAMYLGNQRYIHSTAGNNCHGVVINSLDPDAEDYRADLPEKLESVGSIF